MSSYPSDPKIIESRYDQACGETGRAIQKGDKCVWYPKSRKVFHMESDQAQEFRDWSQDVGVLGYNY